jgi:hypothetical protein
MLPEHVKKFRLGIYTSDYEQPISLMRVMGPFAAMAREEPRLELVRPALELPDAANGRAGGQRLNWDWICQCDAIFLLHPESDVHVHAASLAWQMGIPIWSEYVDDVFNVPPGNPGWQAHKNRRVLRENIGSIVNWSSVVTCVSEHNKRAIAEGVEEEGSTESRPTFANKMLVIPEGCLWPEWTLPRKKCVSWRGLGSHGQDVQEALPQLIEVAKAFPDWTWMLGGDQEILREMGHHLTPICGAERVLLAPYWPTPFDAMMAWANQAPFLHIVPLADTAFNQSKSHLAWLEASAIGAAVIAPDHLPEWQQPGVIPYRHSQLVVNGEGRGATLAEVMMREMRKFKPIFDPNATNYDAGKGTCHPNVEVSRAAIYPARTLYAMNRRRWAILNKLCRVSSVECRDEAGGAA